MRKFSVLAIALAAASVAQAQSASGPQLFGVIDLGYLNVRADGTGSSSQVGTDGNTSSRLGVRGTEDLGGGLAAEYWLEAAVTPDSGVGGGTSTTNKDSVNPGGLTFGRRSTLGLKASWGEVRLGRDYVPSFNNLTVANHPFGTNGVGSAGQLFYPVAAGGTTARTNVRASNSVAYHLPRSLGGFNGTIMYAMGEQPSNAAGGTDKDGNHLGFRVGYGAGPLNAALASGKTKYATGDYTQTNFAINYKVGMAKLMYLWGQNKVGTTKTTANMLGAQVDVSAAGQVRLAYTWLTASGVANDANQWALGYQHALSKRTALYTNYSRVHNKGTGTRFTVGGGLGVTTAGGDASGFEVGLRHSF